MRSWERYVVMLALVVVAGTLVWNAYGRFRPSGRKVSFTEFLREVESGSVTAILIDGDEVVGVNTQAGRFRTYAPSGYAGFVNRLIDRGVDVSVVPERPWSGRYVPWVVMFILTQAAMLGLLRARA